MTTTPTTKPLPTDLDLHAIHEAFLAAGFTHETKLGIETPNWVYLKPGDDYGFIALPNPHVGFIDEPETFDTAANKRKVAVLALNVLIEYTGDQHVHCGPRNDRERLYAEIVNATNNHV